MKASDSRVRTPGRQAAVKRDTGAEYDGVGERDETLGGKRARLVDGIQSDDGGGDTSDSSEPASADSDGRLWEGHAMMECGNMFPDQEDRRIGCLALFGIGVSDVFSLALITAVCKKMMLVLGCALDLQNGWGFTIASHRQQALTLLDEQPPLFVIGSLQCTIFSLFQALNMAHRGDAPGWRRDIDERLEEAWMHICVCFEFYQLPMNAGRYLLHEHPWGGPDPCKLQTWRAC